MFSGRKVEYTKFRATDEITALEQITEKRVKQLEDFKIKSVPGLCHNLLLGNGL